MSNPFGSNSGGALATGIDEREGAWGAPNDWGTSSTADPAPASRNATRSGARGRTAEPSSSSADSAYSSSPPRPSSSSTRPTSSHSAARSRTSNPSSATHEDPNQPRESITTRAAAIVNRSRGRAAPDSQARRELLQGGNSETQDGGWGSAQQTQMMGEKKDTRNNRELLEDSIRTASQATVVGAQTINKLDQQTEQMHNIDQNLSEINATLTASERLIKGMKSFGGAISNWFSKGPKHKPDTYTGPKQEEKAAPKAASPPKHKSKKEKEALKEKSKRKDSQTQETEEPEGGPHVAAFHDDAYAEEDEMLDQLHSVVSTMKGQAHTMNSQLKYQSGLLDHITDKVERTDGRILKNTADIRKIG